MELPAWKTTREVFAYCWQERRLAVHHGAAPFAIALAASVAVEAWKPFGDSLLAGVENGAVIGIIQLLIYVPLSVTWFRIIVYGESAARNRPLFSFGRLERRLLLWQLLLLAIVAPPLGIMAAILFSTGVGEGNGPGSAAFFYALAGYIAVAVTALLLLSRFSLVLVLAAADRPVTFAAAWRLTRGLGWKLLRALMAITAVAAPISMVADLLPVVGPVVDNIGSMATLLAMATLFGQVYVRLTAMPD